MADNCTEGHRKKAKYLLDEEELEALKRTKSGEGSSKSAEPAPVQPAQPDPPYVPPDPMFPSSYTASAPFSLGSEGANLEYSILSAILGNSPDPTGPPNSGSPSVSHAPQPSAPFNGSTASTNLVTARWPTSDPYTNAGQPSHSGGSGYAGGASSAYGEQSQLALQPSDTTLTSGSGAALSPDYIAGTGTAGYASATQFTPGQGHPPSVNVPQPHLAYSDYTTSAGGQSSPTQSGSSRYPSYLSRAQAISLQGAMRPERDALWASQPDIGAGSAISGGAQGAAAVYQAVTKPYDYTEGYHFLMKHLPTRFDKNDILRIVRALAIFRPSLIALQMPLSEEDEVFVEKCFQRSLIELDKLVSFSGTPTVAWRRTGEICLVGPEFCMLTGWEKEELVGRRKYIYELFENQSVVEYWENFANHAFENTTQSVYSHCVLLKPSGTPVPCTFCFSIRRDIMDLPSLVIGQWLPLL